MPCSKLFFTGTLAFWLATLALVGGYGQRLITTVAARPLRANSAAGLLTGQTATILLHSFLDNAAAIWAVGDGQKIKQDEPDSPLKDGSSVWDGTEINIFGARNEIVAFQLQIMAGQSRDVVAVQDAQQPSLRHGVPLA